MPPVSLIGILSFFIIAQLVQTQSCNSPQPASPPVAVAPSPAPTDEVVTTRDGVRFRVEVVLTRLEIPWAMAFAPDGRLFLTERPGRVRIFDAAARTADIALTMDDVWTQGEAGLLGLALDPEFTQNRRVYLYYTAAVGNGAVNRIVRYREVGGRLGERSVLLDNIPAEQIHDGGRMRFGPDGLLYATTGDAANERLPQDVASPAGKVLRITTDGFTPRANPYGSPVYSLGHRNPQGFDWHPVTGDMWESEHGATGNDEINVIDAGLNYGWPVIQANQTLAGMVAPLAFFNPAVAPSGASFYRGQRFPGFANDLFIATLRGNHLLRVHLDSTPRRISFQEQLLNARFGRLRDVVSGPDGYLYASTNNRDGRGSPDATDDRVIRLVPAS